MGLTDEENRMFNTLVQGLEPKRPAPVAEYGKARKLLSYFLLLIAGMAVVLAGVIIPNLFLGVAGFALMLAGANGVVKLSRFSRRD